MLSELATRSAPGTTERASTGVDGLDVGHSHGWELDDITICDLRELRLGPGVRVGHKLSEFSSILSSQPLCHGNAGPLLGDEPGDQRAPT